MGPGLQQRYWRAIDNHARLQAIHAQQTINLKGRRSQDGTSYPAPWCLRRDFPIWPMSQDNAASSAAFADSRATALVDHRADRKREYRLARFVHDLKGSRVPRRIRRGSLGRESAQLMHKGDAPRLPPTAPSIVMSVNLVRFPLAVRTGIGGSCSCAFPFATLLNFAFRI
jgi:hypothetical protein